MLFGDAAAAHRRGCVSGSQGRPACDDRGVGDLDDLAGLAAALYALPPEDFVAARTDQAKLARAGGARDLARRVGELPKPTAAAWMLNQLVRRRPDEVTQLAALGDQLREAQRTLAGDQLRALTRQRQAVVAAFARQLASLADELGRPLSATVATQVEETLRAAIADPEAGRALLSGRLTTALSYAGMGGVDVSTSVAVPRGRPHRPEPNGEEAQRPPQAPDELSIARRRRLDVARQALSEAEHAAGRSVTELAQLEQEVRRLNTESSTARARVGELQASLDGATEQADAVDARLRRARTARDAASASANEARRAVERAQADCGALSDDEA